MEDKFNWTDWEDLGMLLAEKHPDLDPYSIRFTQLRELVEALDEFEAEPGKQVNEAILEAIQAAWVEERDGGRPADDDD